MAEDSTALSSLLEEDQSNVPLISDSPMNNNTIIDPTTASAFGDDEENPDNPASGSHNGRPIPKQTAAGALLTGGFNTHKVYIGNLPETATLADLEDCFGQLGQCTCSIKRGFGFVDYTEPAAAAEAVAKYHEGHFLGAQIKVELSHARASIPKAPEDGKATARNPPGSDRPSDARKPMHINGPPTQGKPRFNNHHNNHHHNNNNNNNNNNFREPRGPPQNDYSSRRGDSDRYSSGPPNDFRNDAPPYGNDRPPYRDDYRDSRGPPPSSYQDPRYPPRDFDRYGPPPPQRGGPLPPLSGGPPMGEGFANGGPPPLREPRDRPPYDPYYDAPPRGNSGSGGDYPPYRGPRASSPPGYGLPIPSSERLPYGSPPLPGLLPPRDSFDRYGGPPIPGPAFDGPPFNGGPGGDRYDPRGGSIPGREERNPRYNPYGRPSSPPRDGPGNNSYGRSPIYRGAQNDRRRSLSPPPRSYQPFDGNGRPPLGGNGYGGPPSDRYGGGEGYNPNR